MSTRHKRIAVATIAVLAATVAVVLAHRGGQDAPPAAKAQAPAAAASEASGFAWLRPSSVPATWSTLRLPDSPARLPLPAEWRHADGDPGTQTAMLRGPSGEIVGYLNATPRQGKESLEDWAHFRVDHNRDEGDLDVKLLAAVSGFKFQAATGSCVLDSYRTSSEHRYREIACIVAGRSATTVVVGAAPPSRWAAEAPTIERAITSFTT